MQVDTILTISVWALLLKDMVNRVLPPDSFKDNLVMYTAPWLSARVQ